MNRLSEDVPSAEQVKEPMCQDGPTVWLVTYYLAPKDNRVNRSNDPVVGGCT
jgi:hypothetical protein